MPAARLANDLLRKATAMLEVDAITVRFGGVVALDQVSATFRQPIAGIIGPNGAGKTTLMNVLSGFVVPSQGQINRDGQNLLSLAPHQRAHWGLRRSFQKEEIADDLTVFDNVLVQIDHGRGRADPDRQPTRDKASPAQAAQGPLARLQSGLKDTKSQACEIAGQAWSQVRHELSTQLSAQLSAQSAFIQRLRGDKAGRAPKAPASPPASWKVAEVERMLKLVGLEHRAKVLGSELNTFERRLTDVAKCLVGKPRIVMFDEPAGGLSVDETKQLAALIHKIHPETGAQTLVIDHDVDLIRDICLETLVLDFGKRIAFGPTDEVLSDPAVKAAYLGTEGASA